MKSLIDSVESKYRKPQVVDVRSGDTVRVSQKIQEGDKTRTQVFEGMVIRTDKKNSLMNRITVRRIASGVGVEKSFLLHSPLVQKVEVVKRSKVRRNYLSYMRGRAGKSARLVGTEFDSEAVNTIEQQQEETEIVPGEPEDKPKDADSDTEESKPESKEDKVEETDKKPESKPEDKPKEGTEAKAEDNQPADSKEAAKDNKVAKDKP